MQGVRFELSLKIRYIKAEERMESEVFNLPKDRSNKISCSNYRCEIEIFLEIIGGKWKSVIIWELHQHEVIRYNEFKRLLPEITQKMLTQQLRSLEVDGIVSKKVYATSPPKVEYSLTEDGRALIPIFQQMDQWGKDYIGRYNENND